MNSTSALAAALGLAVSLLGCKSSAGCDPKQLGQLEHALADPTIPADMHPQLGMEGIAEACGAHLPEQIVKAMKVGAFGDPAQRAVTLATALAKESGFIEAACPDFKKVFGAMAATETTSKARRIYEGCHYQSLDLMSIDEYDAAGRADFGSAVLAPPLYVWLRSHGVEQAEARKLMRDVIGRTERTSFRHALESINHEFPREASPAHDFKG